MKLQALRSHFDFNTRWTKILLLNIHRFGPIKTAVAHQAQHFNGFWNLTKTSIYITAGLPDHIRLSEFRECTISHFYFQQWCCNWTLIFINSFYTVYPSIWLAWPGKNWGWSVGMQHNFIETLEATSIYKQGNGSSLNIKSFLEPKWQKRTVGE